MVLSGDPFFSCEFSGDDADLCEEDRAQWEEHLDVFNMKPQGFTDAGSPSDAANQPSRLTVGFTTREGDETQRGHSDLSPVAGGCDGRLSMEELGWQSGNKLITSAPHVIYAGTTAGPEEVAATQSVPGCRATWPGLSTQAPNAQSRTWSDFLTYLNGQLPPNRRTEMVAVSGRGHTHRASATSAVGGRAGVLHCARLTGWIFCVVQEKVFRRTFTSKARAEQILTDTFEGKRPAKGVDIFADKPQEPVETPRPTILQHKVSVEVRDMVSETVEDTSMYQGAAEDSVADDTQLSLIQDSSSASMEASIPLGDEMSYGSHLSRGSQED
jgi:hypothetical protein